MQEGKAGTRPRRLRWDLLALGTIVVLAIVLGAAPQAARLPVGLVAVLFAPGYALATFLLPTDEQVDGIERIGLAIGLSFAMIAVEAILLDRANALTIDSIRNSSATLTLLLIVAAAFRRHRLQPATNARENPDLVPRPRTGRAIRFTQAILIANLGIAALAYAITIAPAAPQPTGFYVVGRDGLIGGYPRQVRVGDPMNLRIGIQQGDADSGNYRVEARHGETLLLTLDSGVIASGHSWESNVELRLDSVGPDREVIFVLLRDGDPKPLRLLRLFVDVLETTQP